MTTKKHSAQNIIEFVFVFLVTMSVFFSIIELGLYWRAKYCVANLANEVIANIQITAQNRQSEQEIINNALTAVKKSSGLLNLSNTEYSVLGSNGSYTIKSNFLKQGQSVLVVFVDIHDIKNSDVRVGAAYRYNGIFLFKDGKTISSVPMYSVQKF